MLVGYPTRTEWLDSYNERGTRNTLACAIKQFDVLLVDLKIKEKEFFVLARPSDSNELTLVLDKLKNYLQNKYASKTAKSYFSFIVTWWRVNGVTLDEKEIQRRIRWNKVHKEMRYTPDRAMIQKIIDNSSFQYKVFYYMAVSTGARQSEILSLKIKDVNLRNDIPSVHFLAENTKTKQERYSFLTPEASTILQKHLLDKPNPNELIFSFDKITLQKHFDRLRRKMGNTEKYKTGVAKLTIHRLRAYAKKQLSRASGDDFAHVILGHSEGLATYDGDNIEGLREDYTKAVPELTIELHAKDTAKRENQSEQIKLMRQEIDLLKMKIPHDEDVN